MVEIRDV